MLEIAIKLKADKISAEYKHYDPSTHRIAKAKGQFVTIDSAVYQFFPEISQYEFNSLREQLLSRYQFIVQKQVQKEAMKQKTFNNTYGKKSFAETAQDYLENFYVIKDIGSPSKQLYLVNKKTATMLDLDPLELELFLPRKDHPFFYEYCFFHATPVYEPRSQSLFRPIRHFETKDGREHEKYQFNTYQYTDHRYKYIINNGNLDVFYKNPLYKSYCKIFWDYVRFLTATEEDARHLLYYMAVQVRPWQFQKLPVLIFLVGEQGVGKNTFFRLLKMLHGKGNFTSRDGANALQDTRITDYCNKTLLTANEVEVPTPAHYNQLKLLADDDIGGNIHYQGFKEISLNLNTWLSTNNYHRLRGLHRDNRRDVIIGMRSKSKRLEAWVEEKALSEPEGWLYSVVFCQQHENKLPKEMVMNETAHTVKVTDYVESIFAFLCNLGSHEDKLHNLRANPYKSVEHSNKIYSASSPNWIFEFFCHVWKKFDANNEQYANEKEVRLKEGKKVFKYKIPGSVVLAAHKATRAANEKAPGVPKLFDQLRQYEPVIHATWTKTVSDAPDIYFDDPLAIHPDNYSSQE